jgi:hypothetical protein
MLKQRDETWWEGDYILIRDDGGVGRKKTKVWPVFSKSQELLGEIRWFGPWRRYVFSTREILLEEKCMADLSEFIIARTAEHKAGWKKKSVVDWDRVKAYDEAHK